MALTLYLAVKYMMNILPTMLRENSKAIMRQNALVIGICLWFCCHVAMLFEQCPQFFQVFNNGIAEDFTFLCRWCFASGRAATSGRNKYEFSRLVAFELGKSQLKTKESIDTIVHDARDSLMLWFNNVIRVGILGICPNGVGFEAVGLDVSGIDIHAATSFSFSSWSSAVVTWLLH